MPKLTFNAANKDEAYSQYQAFGQIVDNMWGSRMELCRLLGGNGYGSVNQACNYPDSLLADFYRALYDRNPIAERVVNVWPFECWKVTPEVHEDEDADTDTPFEEAWDALGKDMLHSGGGRSWFSDEEGGLVWSYLKRVDILSGIGVFGILLLGLDDGLLLEQPAYGIPQDGTPVDTKDEQDRIMDDAAEGRKQGKGVSKGQVTHDPKDLTEQDKDITGVSGIQSPTSRAFGGRDDNDEEPTQPAPRTTPSLKKRMGSPRTPQANGQQRANPAQEGALNGDEQSKSIYGDIPNPQDLDLPKDAYGGALPPNMQQPFASTMGTDAQYFGTQFSPAAPTEGMDTRGIKGSNGNDKPPARLLFLRVFDESLVQVVQYEASIRSPRFGQPIMYRITLNDPRQPHTGVGLPLATVRVHWSRVVHVAETVDTTSEIFAKPRMRPLVNRLIDLDRLYGGSAMMYWQGAFPGLSLETNPQLGGDVIVDPGELKTMMEQYSIADSGGYLARYLLLRGLTAKSLSPQVVDPTPQITAQLQAVCIELKMPQRVFMGSERGELASSQDDANWNGRVLERCNNYLTPRVIVPFIDRLIMLGVLPEPEQYRIKWPDLDSNTDKDRAAIALQQTQALAAYVQGGVEQLMPPNHFLPEIMGIDEEKASAMLDQADQEQQEQEQQQADLAEQHGLVPQVDGFEQPNPKPGDVLAAAGGKPGAMGGMGADKGGLPGAAGGGKMGGGSKPSFGQAPQKPKVGGGMVGTPKPGKPPAFGGK